MSTPLRERPDAPLGTLIFRAGLLPAETIENALEEGVKTGRRLGEILVERNLIKEEDLTRLLAGQKGLPYVNLHESEVEPDAARLLAEDQARLFTALPIGFEEGVPVVAVADPTNDVLNRNIREALGQEARFVVAARSELNDVITEVFSGAYNGSAEEPEAVEETVEEAAEEPAAEFDIRVPLPDPEEEESVAEEPQPLLEPAPVEPEPQPVLEVAPPVTEAEAGYELDVASELKVEPERDVAPELEAEPELEVEPELEPQLEVEAEPEPAPELVHATDSEPTVEPAPAEAPAELVVAASEPLPAASETQPEPVSELEPEPEPAQEPVFEVPVPELETETEDETEPEPVPLAAEQVVPESDPQTNGWVPEIFEDDTPPSTAPDAPGYRVSIRLTSGEQLMVADCDDIGEAKGYAKALTKQLGATDSDDWPFVNGRFLKPDTIVSVDVEPL